VDTSLPSSRTPAWEGALLLKPLVSFWHNAQQTFVFHFHLELVVLSLSGLGLPFHTSLPSLPVLFSHCLSAACAYRFFLSLRVTPSCLH
jgi:hypothetical protein